METKEGTISEPTTSAENIAIEAKYVALRDVNFNYGNKGIFFPIDFSAYSEEVYAIPVFIQQLFEKLRTNRILIVNQPASFDTASLLRYVGGKFSYDEKLGLLELDSSKESYSLIKELPKQERDKVFVLDHLHPQAIDFDLSQLVQLAAQRNFYYLISTEVSQNVWQIKRNAFSNVWFNIPSSNNYSVHELSKDLLRKISAEKAKIPYLKEEEISFSSKISEEISIQDIADQFQTPEQINLFIYQLIGLEKKIETKKLKNVIQQATDESSPTVVKWFNSLPQAQKLIVIGACLLEGVYDDQFFQLMSEIIEKHWKNRDRELLSLDYCDLEFLHNYFEFDKLGEGKYILKGKYPEQRFAIIEAAWDSYRRHILYALPLLIDAARNTMVSTEVNWEKFGTQQRRMAIRQAVSATVSDIGIHSLETVQHALLEFAAVSEVTLQRITAKAMARWREYGKHELLFDTISRWIESEEIEQTVNEFLKNEKISTINKSSTDKALTYIKSTSVLALGYAATYDPPDELDQRLIDLLKLLISDKAPQIRERIKSALPKLIRLHINKLLNLITEDLIQEDDLQELVSNSLAEVYIDNPEVIQKILNNWVLQCLEVNSELNRRQKFTNRDKVVVTALRTYQKIDLKKPNGIVSIPELYKTLKLLVESERRGKVLEVVWETIIVVLQLDFEEAEKQLPTLCADPFSNEANYLVHIFCRVYFEQRVGLKQLTDYRLKLQLEEEELPVWRNPVERPKTEIEKGVNYLLNSNTLSNKQLATKILWQFGKEIDKEELENLYKVEPLEVEPKIKPVTQTAGNSKSASIIAYSNENTKISTWIKFWIFILCIRDENSAKSRETLKAFYLTIRSKGLQSKYTQFLLNRWKNPSSGLQKIASRLHFLTKRAF